MPTPQDSGGTRTIDGQIFVDENGNGEYDVGERVFPNIIVILIDSSTDGQTVAITTQSDENGVYEFVDIPASNYVISYAVPPGYLALNGSSFNVDASNGNVEIQDDGLVLDNSLFDKELFLPFTVK